jgi:hypothetical protein
VYGDSAVIGEGQLGSYSEAEYSEYNSYSRTPKAASKASKGPLVLDVPTECHVTAK